MRIRRPLTLFCILVIIVCIVKNGIYEKKFPAGELPSEAVTLQGRLDSWESGNGQTILFLSDVFFYGNSAEEITNSNSIGLRCYVTGSYNLKLGQNVAVRGFLSLPHTADNPGGFDSATYYKSRGYAYVLYDGELVATGQTYDVILQGLALMRQYATKQLRQYLTAEDAGVMEAMLLGNKSNIEAETKELYRSVGIYHILAISGLHISMIGGCVCKLLNYLRCKRVVAVAISLGFIVLYGIMIGMPPSAFRAIVMFGFGQIAPLILRSHDKITSMAVAAACLAVWEPFLMFDAGVQLSFLAVLGIVVLYPTFLGIHKHHMKFADGLWVSFAVTYMTLPVIMATYYEVPIYSIVVNVCVLPLVPLLLGLGLGIIMSGNLWPFFAGLCAFLIHMILAFYEKLLSLVSELPGNSYRTGAPEPWRVWFFYIVLCIMIWFVLKLKRKLLIRSLSSENAYARGYQNAYVREQKCIRKIMINVRCIQIVIMVFLVVILLVPKCYDCRMTFLDVGQGDGICVETGREVYMIDGGSTSQENIAEYVLIPFLKYHGITTVHGWFLTHPDKDHTSGFTELCEMEDMGGVRVEILYIPEILQEEFAEITALAEEKGIRIELLSAGENLAVARGRWSVLSPESDLFYEDENAASLVLYFACESGDALFMGDAGTQAEAEAVSGGIQAVSVLKVGHHGSAVDCNSEEFIQRICPDIAVISCGENNVYGHPHVDTLERLEQVSSYIWITAEQDALTIIMEEGIRNKEK